MNRSCPILGWVCQKEKAYVQMYGVLSNNSCWVETMGGGCSLMTELPVLLASGVRRTPDLSGIEKCGFEKEMSQKLRHILLSESID